AGPPHLTLIHKKTLKMPDDVLCVRYRPNQKLIAVALLDATVKLPVLSIDISSDNKLLVTGSADKNIKIWASILEIVINQCSFCPGYTLYFTANKDKFVKYWDGDK
ncbi:10589_t:CDS:2, partial [Scutellospora calospora]